MFNKSVIHKEELFAVCPPGMFRFSNKAAYGGKGCFSFQRYQVRVYGFSENTYYTLSQVGLGKLEYLRLIVDQSKGNFRVSQCHMVKLIDNVSKFSLITFKELSPGGNIKEQISDLEIGTCRSLYCFPGFQLGSRYTYLSSQFITFPAGLQDYFSHSSHGSQGFPPESAGTDGKEIFCPGDL